MVEMEKFEITKEQLDYIGNFLETHSFIDNVSILGSKIENPKKTLQGFYDELKFGNSGDMQMKAAFHHAKNIIWNQLGKTDAQIAKKHWNEFYKKTRKKTNLGYGKLK